MWGWKGLETVGFVFNITGSVLKITGFEESKKFSKGTQGFIHCSFKVASLATLNKQMPSSLATYDAWSLVNHKARLNLVLVHMVYICTALIDG